MLDSVYSILLVDDHDDSREVAGEFLRLAGFEVTECGTAESALESIGAKLVDLVVTDVMLPGMNGYDAASVLRSDARTARIPIVALTGHSMSDNPEQARLFDRVLVKPIEPYRLISAVKELLDRRAGAAP